MITINPDKIVRNVNTSGEFIFRGGLALQAEVGAQNVKDLERFLRTPKELNIRNSTNIITIFK